MTRPRPIRTASEHTFEVARTARYYMLGDESVRGGVLWIVLHGFGQLAGDFIEYFKVLDDGGNIVVAPEALNRYYTASQSVPAAERPVGATWMTREHRDAEINDYVRYLDGLHDSLVERLAPREVVVIGFSQGGATALRWAVQGSATPRTLILWGATVPPDADLAAVRQRLTDTKLYVVVGRTDQFIAPDAVAHEKQRLESAGVVHELVEYDAGHSIKRAVLTDLAARISAQGR